MSELHRSPERQKQNFQIDRIVQLQMYNNRSIQSGFSGGRLTPLIFSVVLLTISVVRIVSADTAGASTNADAALDRCSKILKYGDLSSPNEPSKIDAVHALGLLGDRRAVPLLIEHLENEKNDSLRFQIVRSLGWLEATEAVPALENALTDRYPHVRKGAAVALKKITGKDYAFDQTGLPDPAKLREMLEESRRRKTGEPGATDNPGDTQ